MFTGQTNWTSVRARLYLNWVNANQTLRDSRLYEYFKKNTITLNVLLVYILILMDNYHHIYIYFSFNLHFYLF